jgi:hypothetical protein
MAVIIQFPQRNPQRNPQRIIPQQAEADSARPRPPERAPATPPVKRRRGLAARLFRTVLRVVWVALWLILVAVWPLLSRLLGLDFIFQIMRTLYYWKSPGMHAGWTFFRHFAVFFALTLFVMTDWGSKVRRSGTKVGDESKLQEQVDHF